MGKIIGIDLGTTNSVVAIMEAGEPKIISNEEGARTTPSVVAYTKKDILVGASARRQSITNPENTIYSAKRFIGHRLNECSYEVDKHPFKLTSLDNGDVGFLINDKKISPPQVSSHILQKLKRSAEAYLGQNITEAVITVPAYFNDSQRQATRDAGKIAGLEVKRIVNEPTAASLAYGLDKKVDEKIVVFDLGGGTFDISILEVGEKIVEVISTNGDTHLGGDDFDNVIIEYLIKEFKKTSGLDVSRDIIVIQRLKEAAEKAKIELSNVKETEINLPFLTADSSGPKHMYLNITRSKFEQLINNNVQRILDPCKKALADAKLKIEDINQVILVGGSTRIPMVKDLIKKIFNTELNHSVNPDEVVALGAAVQAGILSGDVKDMLLLDVTPLSLGIETLGGVNTILIPRNTTVPTKKSEIFSTAADNQTSVEVHVIQGERKMASNNRSLGRFHLEGVSAAPRGVPQIEVTFNIDANSIVHVSAKDKATNKEQKITITASSGLSDEEVEKMIKDAEHNKEDDKKNKDLIDERNKLDSSIYNLEKMIKDSGEKLSKNDVLDAEKEISEAKEKIAIQNLEELKKINDILTSRTHKFAEEVYKQSSSKNTTNKQENDDTKKENNEVNNNEKKENNEASDNVIDAEFEEKK